MSASDDTLRDEFDPRPPPGTIDDAPLLSDDEVREIQAFKRTRAWRLLSAAMARDREDLLQSQPATTEQIWQTWGAITRLSRYLREGPLLVVYYRRYMAEQEPGRREARAAKAADGRSTSLDEAPDFEGDV